MHIRRISLENVQAHKDTVLELNPALNIIQGPTNCGKSSIIRALAWCLYGEGNWQTLKKHGTSAISVKIEFSNGVLLTRLRSSQINRYTLHIPGKEDQVFDNPGRNNVPELIQEVVGLRKVKLDGSTAILNLAGQHEEHFLLSDSAGSAQRKLGILTHTDQLDNAGMACRRHVLQEEKERKSTESKLAEITSQLDAYHWLPTAEEKVVEIESLLQDYDVVNQRAQTLEALHLWLQGWNTRYASTQKLTKVGDLPAEISVLIEQCSAGKQLLDYLEKLRVYSGQYREARILFLQKKEAFRNEQQTLELQLQAVASCPLCGRPF